MIDSALEHLETHFRAHRGLLVAWSGGLDSTVLLDLARRAARRACGELTALHVDHGLREGSEGDARFCRRVGRRLGLAVRTLRLDLADDASPQAAARTARYTALAEEARRLGIEHVATGHHADDAVETALLGLSEGSGGSAVARLAAGRRRAPFPCPGGGDLTLFRPLLEVPRTALEGYAERRGLEWSEDPTNRLEEYARNRARKHLAPELVELADGHGPILRSLQNLADEAEAVEAWSRRLADRADLPAPHREAVALRRAPLADAPAAVVATVLREALAALPGPGRATRDRLEAVREAIQHREAGNAREPAVFTLRGATITVQTRRVLLEVERGRGDRARQTRRALPMKIDLEGEPDGERPWFGGRLTWRSFEPADPTDFPTAPDVTWFDAEQLPVELLLRGPEPGERFPALGLDGSKAVADVLRAGEVPVNERWRWPCLAAVDLLWVCSLRRAGRALVDATTRRVVEFRWRPPSR